MGFLIRSPQLIILYQVPTQYVHVHSVHFNQQEK